MTKEWLAGGMTEDVVFVATVTVKADAPWGQSSESVGACATDEETGRRKITIADAIATAETRATNRAVSNLIAMGEVSAEEMSKGKPAKADQKFIEDMDATELASTRERAIKANRQDVVDNIDAELEKRRLEGEGGENA